MASRSISSRPVSARSFLTFLLAGLSLAFGVGRAAGAPAGADSVPTLASLQAESDLVSAATTRAAAGDISGAWRMLSAGAVGGEAPSARLGHRVMTVSGFLRGLNRYAEAEALARLALQAPWSEPRNARTPTERAQVRFWRAQIVADILEDSAQALAGAEDRDSHDEEDPRMPELRKRLQLQVANRHSHD